MKNIKTPTNIAVLALEKNDEIKKQNPMHDKPYKKNIKKTKNLLE